MVYVVSTQKDKATKGNCCSFTCFFLSFLSLLLQLSRPPPLCHVLFDARPKTRLLYIYYIYIYSVYICIRSFRTSEQNFPESTRRSVRKIMSEKVKSKIIVCSSSCVPGFPLIHPTSLVAHRDPRQAKRVMALMLSIKGLSQFVCTTLFGGCSFCTVRAFQDSI